MLDLQSALSQFQNRCPQILRSDRVRVVEDSTGYGARLVANRPFKRGDPAYVGEQVSSWHSSMRYWDIGARLR
jgi:hypothetical protein